VVCARYVVKCFPKEAKCCQSVASPLPILLPLKSFTINNVTDVASFSDYTINYGVSWALNPNRNLETGNPARFLPSEFAACRAITQHRRMRFVVKYFAVDPVCDPPSPPLQL
jgi:hypothetical protein